MKKQPTAKKTAARRTRKKKPDQRHGVGKMEDAAKFAEFLNGDFTQRLVEHMHRAKKAALKDKE